MFFFFFFFFFSFYFIRVLRPVKIISLILSRVNRKVGRKREIPEKNHLITRKQNLACLTWPKLGSNPERWDDERFRALKISDHNHSDTGAAVCRCVCALDKILRLMFVMFPHFELSHLFILTWLQRKNGGVLCYTVRPSVRHHQYV